MLRGCQITNGTNQAGIEPPFCLIETFHLRETSHCKPHPGRSLTKPAPRHVGPAPVPNSDAFAPLGQPQNCS